MVQKIWKENKIFLLMFSDTHFWKESVQVHFEELIMEVLMD